ncbi:MAG TPA: M3 family oligoendopeptidase [Anaerolineaceae bacterium]|nr:M3 family oligoendopeptidase [Anaerolineaceae bacterium]
MTTTPPRWNLSNIYASVEDPRLASDLEWCQTQTRLLESRFESELLPLTPENARPEALAPLLNHLVDDLNALILKSATIDAFLYGLITTNSFDKQAEQMLSRFEIARVPFQNLLVRLRAWFGRLGQALPAALNSVGSARAHAFMLLEEAEQSRYQMSEPEELLANELTLSGGSAWDKLQGTLTSQKTVPFELDGKVQDLPMPALINLRSHPSAEVRQRAYETEQHVWEELKEPLAACLNGVKGETITLDRHRGRRDSLHASLDMARIDQATLDAMLAAIQASLPSFRRYFQAKARLLGMEKLPWWSLLAPLGESNTAYSFEEARDVILTHFGSFSAELKEFARTAFEQRWIDAEQRPGKRGGAYCMEIPALKESRVLCNFDGSLDQVMTIAHELGHGFHNYCAFKADKTPLQTRTPMTLAETASIMCETIVFNAILASVKGTQDELPILESNLSGCAEVIVDIYSRFLFEQEVFTRRQKSTLSADEISEIMLDAQRTSYGDGLDENVLHKYMWTWKPHYYSPSLAFYNYPYAFGLLFATGLYAIFQERGEAFVPEYMQLLASTGEASAADLAARFGIDIRDQAFWAASLRVIARRIERYIELSL